MTRPNFSTHYYRGLLIALIGCIGVSVLLAIMFVLAEGEDPTASALGTSLLCVLWLGVIAAAETARRKRRVPITMVLSMLLSTVTIVGLNWLIWFGDEIGWQEQETWTQNLVVALIVGVMLAHAGAFSLIPAKSLLLRIMKVAVIFCASSCGALVIGLIGIEQIFGGPPSAFFFFFMPIILIVGFIAVVGTVAVPIAAFSRANREEIPIESVHSRVLVHLACPKCKHRQDLRAGNSRCGSCGAAIFVEIEEPRCECGYLIYRLQGDTCPECGRPIKAAAAPNESHSS